MRACVLALALALAGGTRTAAAQAEPPGTWVSLDGSPAGTPASVTLDAQASTPQHTALDLVVHGYWSTPRQGDDGRAYQQISVPGLMTTMDFGAPELPVYRFALGLVTGANAIAFTGAQVRAQATYANVLPWPHIIGAIPDTFPRPERFVRDDARYLENYDFPGGYATTFDGIDPGSGGLHVGVCELHPFQWNASGTLTVSSHVHYTFDHPGNPTPVEMGSSMSAGAALAGIANGGVISPYVTWDGFTHHGYFLFVVPSGYEYALTPLIEQKKKHGFWVTVIHTDDIPYAGAGEPACKPTRDAIRAWYLTTPHGADHYCILAGNHVDIPPCYSLRPALYELGPELWTDDYFGDADGNGVDDEGQEVYVGRIAMNDATELTTAVAHILAYEDSPSPQEEFDHAALINWNSASDIRFKKALDLVKVAPYASVTPTFDTIDGGLPSVTNAWVDAVARADGILAYDGHGGPTDWWAWNFATYSYSNAVLDGLQNHPVFPVIWSLACYTGDITSVECFGKHWLTHSEDGAASFYGATGVSWIWDNGIMAKRLFDAVFNRAITIQGIAIAFEEFGTILELGPDNPVQYLLLGDPEMHIRRTNVAGPPYVVHVPPFLVAGPVPPIDINVKDPGGRPAPGVKVALWKRVSGPSPRAAARTAGDEVLDNRYTDANGNAHFDLPPLTTGTLFVTTMDDVANVMQDSVAVGGGLTVDPGRVSTRFAVAGSVAHGQVAFLLPEAIVRGSRVVVFDAGGRAVRTLRVEPGQRSIAWDGTGERGAHVRPGLFLARLVGNGFSATARFVLLD